MPCVSTPHSEDYDFDQSIPLSFQGTVLAVTLNSMIDRHDAAPPHITRRHSHVWSLGSSRMARTLHSTRARVSFVATPRRTARTAAGAKSTPATCRASESSVEVIQLTPLPPFRTYISPSATDILREGIESMPASIEVLAGLIKEATCVRHTGSLFSSRWPRH
jgi:hypothetical protein